MRRDLERAELLLVARVVQDGGIGPWRKHAEDCVQAARQRASGMRLSRTETAALVVALADERVRDGCWLQVEADPVDPTWIRLWSHLVRHALPPFRAEPLFLLAWSAWRLGDCTLARTAADAALREEPRHGAAAKLDVLLTAAVTPDRLRSLSGTRTAGGGAP